MSFMGFWRPVHNLHLIRVVHDVIALENQLCWQTCALLADIAHAAGCTWPASI